MDLYLDTSALIKLYLAEPGRIDVVEAVRSASKVTTSMIAYAEARSAFSRRHREAALTDEQHSNVVQAFDVNWRTFDRIPVLDDIAYSAGELAHQLGLRGFDALHVASAIWMQRNLPDLAFFTYDTRLLEAARQVVPVYETE